MTSSRFSSVASLLCVVSACSGGSTGSSSAAAASAAASSTSATAGGSSGGSTATVAGSTASSGGTSPSTATGSPSASTSSSSASAAAATSGSNATTSGSVASASGATGSAGATGSSGLASATAGTSGSSGSTGGSPDAGPACDVDGKTDGTETDVDCGGGCTPCGLGLKCLIASDCASRFCNSNVCDLLVSPLDLSSSTSLSSLDSADGQTLYATRDDWSIWVSTDGARTWRDQFEPVDAGHASHARIHVSRADAEQILVYGSNIDGSAYDKELLVSHDGLAHVADTQNGLSSWGSLCAFSDTDAQTIYFFGDNQGSLVSTNAGDTTTSLTPPPAFVPNGDSCDPGSSGIDLFNSQYAWVSVVDEGTSAHHFSLYDGTSEAVVDLTSKIATAMPGKQAPAGFELYATSSDGGAYRMRIIGDLGGVVTSDDEGTTFKAVAPEDAGLTDGGPALASCGSQTRQIVSSANRRTVLATWCPGTRELSFSLNGGAAWVTVNGPAWTQGSCSSISGVIVSDTQLIVSCEGSGPLRVDYLGEADLPDGGARPSTCFDGVQDGTESDVDCGGSCAPCGLALNCSKNADCATHACGAGLAPGSHLCGTPTCTDELQDGLETGVDCGGPDCPACSTGGACILANDCASGVCSDGGCAAPSCSDGVKNGSETDVDCGGSCPNACSLGQGCVTSSDCSSGTCTSGLCDTKISFLSLPDAGATLSSIDTADGQTLWATGADWTVLSSDGGAVWKVRYTPIASESPGKARIHANRANPEQVLVYAYTDTQTSTYDTATIVSHDAFSSATELSDGVSSWGNICAFSAADPAQIYFFGDNGSSLVSTNAGDTTSTITQPTFGGTSLWTAGAAEVDPLDDSVAWISLSGDPTTTPPTYLGQYSAAGGRVTDFTSAAETALVGQGPAGFEVYATNADAGAYRMRVIGVQGAIAVSDDEGGTFTSVSTASNLPDCGAWESGLRQITSYAGDRTALATWCPKKNDLALSRNSGRSWAPVENAPSWTSSGCDQISGVVLTGNRVVVACFNGPSVSFPY